MRNRKKHTPRRQKTRRWCLAALGLGAACLALLCFLFYPTLSPAAAMHLSEKNLSAGKTELVTEVRSGGVRFLLAENENVLMVTPFCPIGSTRPVGMTYPLLAVDLSQESKPAVTFHLPPSENQPGYVLCLGVVEDCPQAVTARIIADSPYAYSVPIQETQEHLRYFWFCQTYSDPAESSHYNISNIALAGQEREPLGTVPLDPFSLMPIYEFS